MTDRDNLNPPDTVDSSHSLAVDLLLRNKIINVDELVDAAIPPSASDAELLEILVLRGKITEGLKNSIGCLVAEFAKRESADEPTASLGETIGVAERPSSASPTKLGDYEILNEIAKGGMGVVYRARQTSLNRVVALKMIRSGEFADQTQVERFYTEAEAAAQLDHPGIVPIYEVGQYQGQHFYSMAFIEGRSLDQAVKVEGPFEANTAARIMQECALTIQAAHEKGVVHRDIKPHNILLNPDGQTKITDFGLAKLTKASDSELTAEGQVLGTPSYMPPEQAAGAIHEIGPAADIYSLGATLYFMLVGRAPFETSSIAQTIRQVLDVDPIPPRKYDASIPRDLETICLKCLRKEIRGRYDSAKDLADDLDRAIRGEPIVARRVGRVERSWKWCQRNPAMVLLLAACLLVAFAGWIAYDRLQARSSVDVLLKADARSVLPAANLAAGHRYWTDPLLRSVLDEDPSTPADYQRQLHARLAVVQYDRNVARHLLDELLQLPLDRLEYLSVIRGTLMGDEELTSKCWLLLRDTKQSKSTRFRAALALAGLAPTSDEWSTDDYRFVADQVVATDGVYQREIWRLLQGLGKELLQPLESSFADSSRSERERVSTAYALAHFAAEDGASLSQWLPHAMPAQFEAIFEKYRLVKNDATLAALIEVALEVPDENAKVADRISIGKRRAAACCALLRLGHHEPLLQLLRYQDDPEALTQFVHSCKRCGVKPAQLLNLLWQIDERRGPLGRHRTKVDDTVLFGLLFAIGEFPFEDLGGEADSVRQRLVEIYQRDPSSRVHGACGWLLRQWGFQDEVEQVDRTPLAYDPSGHREWFVKQIGVDSKASGEREELYMTFVVFSPVETVLGSPKDELGHVPDESMRRVTLTRPLAVSTHELTWHQWNVAEGNIRQRRYAEQFSRQVTDGDPVFGLGWSMAIQYCSWLTIKAGMSSADQCYADKGTRDYEGRSAKNWSLVDPARRGFRLLSEAEWEHVCRGGTRTAFSFGNDSTYLKHYAWFRDAEPNWVRPVGQLRPNPRGLFDVHGNVAEWCYDRYSSSLSDDTDPFGPSQGNSRLIRGGGNQNSAGGCRSSDRSTLTPTRLNPDVGFRLAFSLPGQKAASQD